MIDVTSNVTNGSEAEVDDLRWHSYDIICKQGLRVHKIIVKI